MGGKASRASNSIVSSYESPATHRLSSSGREPQPESARESVTTFDKVIPGDTRTIRKCRLDLVDWITHDETVSTAYAGDAGTFRRLLGKFWRLLGRLDPFLCRREIRARIFAPADYSRSETTALWSVNSVKRDDARYPVRPGLHQKMAAPKNLSADVAPAASFAQSGKTCTSTRSGPFPVSGHARVHAIN